MPPLALNLVHVVINQHGPIFAELLELLQGALAQLDVPVERTVNQLSTTALNVIVGHTCFLLPDHLRAIQNRSGEYVVFQSEVLDESQGFIAQNAAYLEFLRGARQIWDYNPSNDQRLRQLGCPQTHYVPIGYCQSLERIVPAAVQDVDVLFYGALSPRRVQVIQELRRRGINVYGLFEAYGAVRDEWIARAKIVLNLHQFETRQLEQVRIAYLLNNKCFVISEAADCNPYGQGVVYSDYNNLADSCQHYLRPGMEHERQRIAEAGHAALREIAMLDHLRGAVEALRGNSP